MYRKDWTLLAIAAAEGEPISPVQLQKSLFLLGKKLPRELGSDFYQFRAYNYGPFAVEIYQDAEELECEGLVVILGGGSWRQYAVTPQGIQKAEELKQRAPARAFEYLEAAVAWTRSLPFEDLLRAIYTHYPQYRANSVFQPS